MTDQQTPEQFSPPKVGDWRILMSIPKIPCPGGCGEMIDAQLTHRPWACAAAKAGHSGEVATLVDGVKWCSTHSSVAGIVEYLSTLRCVKSITDVAPCILHELFYFGAKDSVDEH